MNRNPSLKGASGCALLSMNRSSISAECRRSLQVKTAVWIFKLTALSLVGVMAGVPFRAVAAKLRSAASAAPAEQAGNSAAAPTASATAEAQAGEVTIEATPQPDAMARKD